jgi:hypothetical protein
MTARTWTRPTLSRINWTILPELMTSPRTHSLSSLIERPAENGGSTLVAASAAVLAELESSLGASQRALLAHDVVSLDQATREQMRLLQALEILWARNVTSASELRAAQRRVLHQCKVQAALLAREQRWLTILANLVAGPGANYASAGNGCAGIDGRSK